MYALRLHGEKILVPGNHDKCFPFCERDFEKWKPQYENYGFQFFGLGHQFYFHYQGKKIGLCHFPPKPSQEELEKYDIRYLEYRPQDPQYDLIFHGHIHEREKEWKSCMGTPLVNVGVDVHGFKPILLQDYLARYIG
jgi:calcineurin-like phosphoesterase family protein